MSEIERPDRVMPDGSPCWCVSNEAIHDGWIHSPLCTDTLRRWAGQAFTELREVWIVFRRSSDQLAGVCAVHSTKASALEDLDLRTGRGRRPDLEHVYGFEHWAVQVLSGRR
jgi:hypothetical protein